MNYIFLILFSMSASVFSMEAYIEIDRTEITVGDVVEASLYIWPVEKILIIDTTTYIGESVYFMKTSEATISENNSDVMVIKGLIVFSKAIHSGVKLNLNLKGEDIPVELRKFSVLDDPEITLGDKVTIEVQEKYSRSRKFIIIILIVFVLLVGVFFFTRKSKRLTKKGSVGIKFEINSLEDLRLAYVKRDLIKSQLGIATYNKFLNDLGDNFYKQSLNSDELQSIKDKFKLYGL